MKTPLITEILTLQGDGREITVCGWVRTKRESKNLEVTTGAALRASGKLVASPASGQAVELALSALTILGEANPETYPLQKKNHSFEFLRENAHLRVRTNTFAAVARMRNQMAYAIHTFFQTRGFEYVHTPLITASDCEGAGEMFQVTTLDLENPPRTEDGRIDYAKDFFGRMAKLTVSGQLNGETYAMAMKNIYTFGPTFRAENSNTARHLAEFWMVEPEMAFCDLYGDMEVAESFLKYVFKAVLDKNGEDMAFFDNFVEKGVVSTLEHFINSPFEHITFNSPFEHMTYTDAIKLLEKENSRFDFPVHWGSDIQSEHERYLTEVIAKRPVIVTDYPKEIKAFYMKMNEDGKTVRGMDVLAPRLGEIIGGSEREYRYDVLVERMKELGLRTEDYWWYLELRKFGSAPHAGFGLGFERAVQYVTGVANIRDVIPYPRYAKNADF